MRAKIKSISSSGIDDIASYIPEDRENFCILLELLIGPAEGVGEEMFSIEICTPLWLANILQPGEIMFGRHLFLMSEYNFPLIFAKLNALVTSFEENDWHELALKISRFAYWEFEDYQN